MTLIIAKKEMIVRETRGLERGTEEENDVDMAGRISDDREQVNNNDWRAAWEDNSE